VNSVGAYSPGVVGGPTNNDAVSNAGANGIPLAAFQTLVAGAYAANLGGVVDFEVATGWTPAATTYADGAANPATVSYGAALNQTLGFWRTDVDPVLLTPFGVNTNSNNGVNVSSGVSYMGVPGGPNLINLTFSKGLSAVGFTVVPRGALRTLTMTALLDDASTLPGSTEQITATNTPGAFFWGFRAPVGKAIVGLGVTSAEGFARFDDLGFVVVPEPASAAMLGLGVLGGVATRRRQRRA
jgi:hypothetical protein